MNLLIWEKLGIPLSILIKYYGHDSNALLTVAHIFIVAEKGFKVITVKEKYYSRVKEYYRNIVEQDVDPTKFISEARIFQEEIKKNKVRKLDPLQVKKIWKKGTKA